MFVLRNYGRSNSNLNNGGHSMQVVIMRGVPGSGKTTWHKVNFPKAIVCSADDFHMVYSLYVFDPKNIGLAHGACLKKFTVSVLQRPLTDEATIVVDNANSRLWELSPYLKLAEAFSVPCRIVRCHCSVCSVEEAFRRGTHSVPADRLFDMYSNLMTEKLPGWKEEIVFTE
jgi:predicted kinase